MIAALLAAWLTVVPSPQEHGTVVVIPPEGPEAERVGWIGALVAELLPRALQRAGVPAVPDADRRHAQEALGVSAAVNTRATSIRVAEALGSTRLVVGSWEERDQQVTLSLRLLDSARASLSAPLVGSAPVAGLAGLVRSLAWDVALAGPRAPQATRDELARQGGELPADALRAMGEALAAREPGARIAGLRRAVVMAPASEETALALARVLVDTSAFEDARAVLAAVRAGSSLARDARFLDGVALLGLHRNREADALFADLVRQQPTAAALANRALARLRLASGVNGASTLLRQALDLEPAALDLPFDLGFALLVEGDAPAAAFWLKGAVRRDPADAQGRLLLSWALQMSGRAGEAEEQWQAAAAVDSTLSAMRTPDLARRLERIAVSERGLLLDPERRSDAEDARAQTASAEASLPGDPAAAIALLARATLLDPYYAASHRLLARAHQATGEPEKAIEELRMALWCREDPTVRRELAQLLRSLGRADEAKRVAPSS
jgi:Tfp pilus assembly protein PilF